MIELSLFQIYLIFGIYVENFLTLIVQLKHIRLRFPKSLGIPSHLRNELPSKILILMYTSLILPLISKRSSTMKIGVERVNQASKLTRTEVNNIVDVAVNCVQIVEQILRQCQRSALSTAKREYDVMVLQH